MSKTYLRFVEGPDSGVISSSSSNNMAILPKNELRRSSNRSGHIVVTPALEYVHLWCAQTGQLLERLCPAAMELGATAEVTAITTSFTTHKARGGGSASTAGGGAVVTSSSSSTLPPRHTAHIAVGYANGCISFWTGLPDLQQQSSVTGGYSWKCILYGQSHKPDTAVLSLAIDVDGGGRLLSSGQDTDITVWDLCTHEPLYRLCGHRGAVVNAIFACSSVVASQQPTSSSSSSSSKNQQQQQQQQQLLAQQNQRRNENIVISGSADGLVKVWDLQVQSCVETLVASDTQVTALAMDPGGRRLFVGVRDDHIKAFSIADAPSAYASSTLAASAAGGDLNAMSSATNILVPHGMLHRKSNKPPTSLSFSPEGGRFLIAVTASNVELFRVLSEEEIARKMQRKLRRRKEQEKRSRDQQQAQQDDEAENDNDADDTREMQQRSSAKRRKTEQQSDINDVSVRGGAAVVTAATTTAAIERTVNEEILPVRLYSVFDHSRKIRCTLVFPSSSSSSSTTVQFLVATNDNTVSILESHEEDAQQAAAAAAGTTVMSDWKQVRGGCSSLGGQQMHRADVRRLLFDSSDAQLASVSHDVVKVWFVSRDATDAAEDRMMGVNDEAFEDGLEEQRCNARLVTSCSFVMSDLMAACVSPDVASSIVASSSSDIYRHSSAAASKSSAKKKNKKKLGNNNNVDDDDDDDDDDDEDSDDQEEEEQDDDHTNAGGGAASSSRRQQQIPLRANGAVFLPGDDLLAISTMEGRIVVACISASSVTSVVSAHSGPINDLVACGTGAWLISCGRDRRVTRWHLSLAANGDPLTTTLVTSAGDELSELTDTPLALGLVPGDQLLAVALQDFTVHLYYVDSFKPFLTLYGHKLPATSVAFSRDGQLCATVGLDKSLRLWGTDFGDCHRSIHAHDNYVHGATFLGATHHVATVSLDGSLKLWDGDSWQLVQQFRVHQRGLLCVAATRDGTAIATAGADRNIRVFFRTEEMLFPAEELEKAATKAADAEAAKRGAMRRLDQIEVGDVGVVGQRTIATAEAAEHLMAALDAVSIEVQRLAAIEAGEVAAGAASLDMQSCSGGPYVYFWRSIERIKACELRHALGGITQTHMHSLLQFLVGAVHAGAVTDYEIAARVVLALVKPAPGSNSNPALLFPDPREAHRVLAALGEQIAQGLRRTTDRVATNVAGLDFMLHRLEQQSKIKIHDRSKVQGHARKFSSHLLMAPVPESNAGGGAAAGAAGGAAGGGQ